MQVSIKSTKIEGGNHGTLTEVILHEKILDVKIISLFQYLIFLNSSYKTELSFVAFNRSHLRSTSC